MTEFSPPSEKIPSKRERVEELFNYLTKTSGDTGWLARVRTGATQGFLGLVDKLSGSMEGFRAVVVSGREMSIAGYVGPYGFEGEPINKDLKPEEVIKGALEAVEELKEVEFATTDKKGKIEFTKRKSKQPWIRLVVPKGGLKGGGFVDVPLKIVEQWLIDPENKGEDEVNGLVKILQKGLPDDWEKDFEVTSKEIDKWREMNVPKDLEGVGNINEPPWIVLSLTNNSNPMVIHDPRMLMHVGIHSDNLLRVNRLRFDYGHVAINGAPGLSKINEMFVGGEVDQEEDEWMSPEDFLKKVRVETVKDEVGVEEWGWASFGDGVNERELAEKVGAGVEIRVRLKVPKEMMKYFLKWSKDWGGSVGLWSLAALLTAGQAAFIPVEEKGKKGLQICLGLGGGELTERLRDAVKAVSGNGGELKSKERLLKIDDFWKFFERGEWKEAFGEEIERGRQGFGTPTALAEMTGGVLRESIEKLSDKFVPKLSVLLKSRWQVSSLGRVPDNLSKAIKDMFFDTAGSKEVSVGIGMLGEMISGRFFMKDPLFWAEALVHLMRGEGSTRIDDLGKAMELVDWEEKGVSKRGVELARKWIESYQEEEGVDGSSFLVGKGEKMSIMNYLRSVGRDSRRREDVIEFSKALVVLMNGAIDLEHKRSVSNLKVSLKSITRELAREKLEWLVVHAGELAMLSEYKEIIKNKDKEALVSIKDKYEWIEGIRKIIERRRSRVVAGHTD